MGSHCPGFGRCKNWRAHRRGVSVCPGGMTSGNPVNPLLGAKCCPARRTLRCPARCRSFSPDLQQLPDEDACAGGDFWPRLKAPSDIRLQLRDDGLILNDKAGGAFTLSRCCRGRRCTAAGVNVAGSRW